MGNRGGIIQGANGFWHYDVVVNKRRYCGNTGNADKKLAKTWVDDFKAMKRREDASLIVGLNHGQFNHAMTCEFLLNEWLKHHHGKHAERLNCDWNNHILPRLKGLLAMEVTTPMVESIRTTFLASPSRRNLQGKVADQIRVKAVKARALGKTVREAPLARHTHVGANKLVRHLAFVFSWGVKTDRLPRMPFKRLKDLVEQEPVKTFRVPSVRVSDFFAHLAYPLCS